MVLKLLLEVWDVSNSLLSRLSIVPRRVRFSLIKKGWWRKRWVADSIFWPQLHNGFVVSWKLCLNLCSLKWLRPSLSLVIDLIPLGFWISKKYFGGRSYEFKYFFLKDGNTLRVSKIRVLKLVGIFSWVYSITTPKHLCKKNTKVGKW